LKMDRHSNQTRAFDDGQQSEDVAVAVEAAKETPRGLLAGSSSGAVVDSHASEVVTDQHEGSTKVEATKDTHSIKAVGKPVFDSSAFPPTFAVLPPIKDTDTKHRDEGAKAPTGEDGRDISTKMEAPDLRSMKQHVINRENGDASALIAPNLSRQEAQASVSLSRPGAYAEPGISFQREDPLQVGLLQDPSIADEEAPSTEVSTVEGDQSSLTRALPVYEEDQPIFVQEAKPYVPKQAATIRSIKQRRFLLALVGLIVVAAVALIAGLLSAERKNNNTGHENGTSNSEPVRVRFPWLPSYTKDTIIQNTTSPQAQAYNWLLADPFLGKYSQEQIEQRFALATLYYATGGLTSWISDTNWLSYVRHECEWFYVEYTKSLLGFEYNDGEHPCLYANVTYYDSVEEENNGDHIKMTHYNNTIDNRFEHNPYRLLWLSSNGLQGDLPEEIYWLTSLESLSLRVHVMLEGTISSQIGKLTNLQHLNMVGVSMYGTVPTEIGLVTGLQECFSRFSGTLPTEIGLLSRLREWGSYNLLHGSIPSEIGSMKELYYLNFEGNKLDQTLPTEIGLLQSLQYLLLGSNEFTGRLPSELGQLPLRYSLHYAIFVALMSESIFSQVNLIDTIFEPCLQLILCMEQPLFWIDPIGISAEQYNIRFGSQFQ
jgi:hypothetical protein